MYFSHKVGFLADTISNFIPVRLLPLRSVSEWEILIYKEHREIGDKYTDSDRARLEYINTVRHFPTYGNQFFTAEVGITYMYSSICISISVDVIMFVIV